MKLTNAPLVLHSPTFHVHFLSSDWLSWDQAGIFGLLRQNLDFVDWSRCLWRLPQAVGGHCWSQLSGSCLLWPSALYNSPYACQLVVWHSCMTLSIWVSCSCTEGGITMQSIHSHPRAGCCLLQDMMVAHHYSLCLLYHACYLFTIFVCAVCCHQLGTLVHNTANIYTTNLSRVPDRQYKSNSWVGAGEGGCVWEMSPHLC